MKLRRFHPPVFLTLLLLTGFVLFSTIASAATTPIRTSPVGPAVTPHLTRPLRDIMRSIDNPRPGPTSPGHEIRNEQLPHPAAPGGSRPADGALQKAPGTTAPTPGVNFDGTTAVGYAPPDTNGDVGPNNYVQWTNVSIDIWDHAGNELLGGQVAGNVLWTGFGGVCETHNDGDPIVQYDPMADRWIMTQFAIFAGGSGTESHQCFAVSQTGDPTGSWFLYDFLVSNSELNDYPHVGVWPSGYFVTTHEFAYSNFAYLGQGLYVFDRNAMLTGAPANFMFANLGNAYGGALPADLDGLNPPPAGSPNYVIAPGSPELDGTTTPSLHIWKASATWGGSPSLTVTGPTDVATATFVGGLCGFARNCVPEQAPATTSDYLDAISDRMMYRMAYRYFPNGTPGDATPREVLVMNHTVTGGSGQAGVRWYELRDPNGTPTIFQQGTYAPDADWRWMGSVAMDNSGNILAGYSKSGPTSTPSIQVAGRAEGDPAGTLGTEVPVMTSGGVQLGTGNRWGDYSSMTVDARDGCTFWYTSEYIPTTGSFNWATRIASFTMPGCTAPSTGTISGTVTFCATGLPAAGALVQTDNGFSGVTDATGAYSITLPPGTYTVTISSPALNCTPTVISNVVVNASQTTLLDGCLSGNPAYTETNVAIDDSQGNNNNVVNPGECINMNVTVENDGCANATNAVGVLSTTTPGVIINTDTAFYGAIAEGNTATNATPFTFVADPSSFTCGTAIDFTLTVTSPEGVSAANFSVPTCALPTQVQNGSITTSSATQTNRLFRDGIASSCSGKACPGSFGAGTVYYETHTFTNPSASVASCVTITVSSNCGTAMHSEAYAGSYDNTNFCTNYLGDAGGSGNTMTYSATLPGGQDLVVVTNGNNTGVTCSAYTISVDGLVDNSTFTPGYSLQPVSLAVDTVATSNSDGNGVFEPGETVNILPTWMNNACLPVNFNYAELSNFHDLSNSNAKFSIISLGTGYGTINGKQSAQAGSPYQVSITGDLTRPAVHWDAMMSETPLDPAGPQVSYMVHLGDSFTDVPRSMLFYDKIEAMLHYGVTLGCQDGTVYCPTSSVLRSQMAAFVARAMVGSDAAIPTTGTVGANSYDCSAGGNSLFTDVAPTDAFCKHIHYIAAHNVTLGCTATEYCPNATVRRDAMAAFIARALVGNDSLVPDAYVDIASGRSYDIPNGNIHFTDMTGSPFSRHAHYLWARGVVDGCTATDYCPTNNVTRQQMAKFIANAFQLILYKPF